MGRSFGSEQTEFVTRRMCFFFLFAVGFMCLLAGFLLGRFVTDHSIAMHEQNLIDELQGNGLHATEKEQFFMLDYLNNSAFHQDVEEDPILQNLRKQNVTGMSYIFSDLNIFQLNVNETNSTTVAFICGTRENDRYVVLSASGEGFDVAVKVAQALDIAYRIKHWKPKRTIIICVFLGSTDSCSDRFLERIKSKIVAYIAIHGNVARGKNEIVVSGSGMVQATILEALEKVKLYHIGKFNGFHSPHSLPRLNLNIPHAVVSFINSNSNEGNVTENQKYLAQIVGLTLWKISEETFFQWNPKYFHENVMKDLNSIKVEGIQSSKDKLNETVTRLTNSIINFNSALQEINVLKTLEVRMVNDRLIDLDKALLCLDMYTLQSKTDFTKFKIYSQDTYTFNMHLDEISDCYNIAYEMVLELANCRSVLNN